MATTIIKNTKILDEKGELITVTVTIQDHKIIKIEQSPVEEQLASGEIIDAQGKLLLPGLIDSHVHFREPGFTHKEDFLTGSMAAAAGGVTTVIDMPNTKPNTLTIDILDEKRGLAKKSIVNYGFHFGSSENNIQNIGLAKDISCVASTKIFMNLSTGKMLIKDRTTMQSIFRNSRMVTVHAEQEKVDLALQLHKETDTPVYFCHLSLKDEIEKIRKAKAEGALIFAEACPHHLFMTSGHFNSLRGLAMMKPSLKEVEDKSALWKALDDGTIDVIGTDHAPHTQEEKQKRIPPFGCPGLETMLPLLLDAMHKGRISLQRIVNLCCETPAKIFGLSQKGKIAVGYDADLILVDLEKEKIVENENLFTKCNWSPFNHWRLKGWPVMTFVNGQKVFDDTHGQGFMFTEKKGKEVAFHGMSKTTTVKEERIEETVKEEIIPIKEVPRESQEPTLTKEEDLLAEIPVEVYDEDEEQDAPIEPLSTQSSTEPIVEPITIIEQPAPIPSIAKPSTKKFTQEVFHNFLIQHNVVGFFDDPITLVSGRKSYWYANCRDLLNTVKRINQLTDFILTFVKERNLDFDYFYGVPDGATKLGDILNFKLGLGGDNPKQKLVIGRKTPKEHGAAKDRYFVGDVKEEDKVIVMEDVTNTGSSLLKAIAQLKEAGVTIVAALGIVNRMQKRDDGRGVQQAVEATGVPYYAMSEGPELLKLAVKSKDVQRNTLRNIEEEFLRYGLEPLTFPSQVMAKQTTLQDSHDTPTPETPGLIMPTIQKETMTTTSSTSTPTNQLDYGNYLNQLRRRTKETGSIACMGLDPVLEKMPNQETSDPEVIISKFYLDILDALEAESVFPAIVKPNIAFYEQYGFPGLRALKKIIEAYQAKGIPVLMDAKRGDIGKTSAAYAKTMFDFWGVDALTVAPYMGHDSISPFLEYCKKGKGVYALCRTSNKGALDLQNLFAQHTNDYHLAALAAQPLYKQVAQKIVDWSAKFAPEGGMCAVVGATYPKELEEISNIFVSSGKSVPLLIPGVGAQGGSVQDVIDALKKSNNELALHRINSSSGINYAYLKEETTDYAGAAVRALRELNKGIGL